MQSGAVGTRTTTTGTVSVGLCAAAQLLRVEIRVDRSVRPHLDNWFPDEIIKRKLPPFLVSKPIPEMNGAEKKPLWLWLCGGEDYWKT